MYGIGREKPVKVTKPKIRIAAGVIACTKLRETEARVLKNMDMAKVVKKDIKRKKKKGPGSLRRNVMK